MAAIYKTDVTLRFFGDDLDPEEITSSLGGIPTVGVRKGGTWVNKGGREITSRKGSWRLEAETRTPGDLDGQISEILSRLTPDFTVWKAFSSRYKADIFCGIDLKCRNEGIELAPETLMALGSRGLKLDLDIYGPETNA